jgi:O-antigen/teichoic acid export membrane protein
MSLNTDDSPAVAVKPGVTDLSSGAAAASTGRNLEIHQGLAGAAADGELKGKSVRGGAITVVGQALSFALQMGSTVVLARLLSPTDYGLQGMVYTLTGFFNLFKDAGLSVASVQRETLTHPQASTLFWINASVGALLATAVASLSPLLVVFYKEPRLLWVTVASASGFLFSGLAVQHRALLNRAMRFATITKIDMGSMVFSFAVGILMAIGGLGYWALVGQAVSQPVYSVVALWVALPWRPGRPARGTGIRSMIRYGSTHTLNSFVVYLAYNTEKILLGRFWGVQQLGIYGRAYSLANLPVQQLIGSAGAVALPILSRMQGDLQRMRRSFLKSLSLVVSLIIPAVIVCSIFADEIIAALLGPKWIGVAPVVRLLTPTVLVFALINPLAWFLQATGRVGRSLNMSFLIAPAVILGILCGLPYGTTGVACGYSAAMVLLIVPCVAWAKHGTGISTKDYWGAVKPPLIAGVGAVVAGLTAKLAFQNTLGPFLLLGLGCALSFAVYALLLLFVLDQKTMYADLLTHLLSRFRPEAETDF